MNISRGRRSDVTRQFVTVITGSQPNLLVISVAPSLDTPPTHPSLSTKNATIVSDKYLMKNYTILLITVHSPFQKEKKQLRFIQDYSLKRQVRNPFNDYNGGYNR